jgi:hypothetical protein
MADVYIADAITSLGKSIEAAAQLLADAIKYKANQEALKNIKS